MADAASKREARRRRILENSANRLQKITGRIRENSVEGEKTLIYLIHSICTYISYVLCKKSCVKFRNMIRHNTPVFPKFK